MIKARSLQIHFQRRSAYTLLELMLALALLGALMTVAWSLMGTFRDAEQRGWKLAHRTQTIRAARTWLQNDMQHLLRDGHAPSIPGSPKPRLIGNPLGFTASIAPSLDPLPFLEQLMVEPDLRSSSTAESEPVASLDSIDDSLVAEVEQTLWSPETLEVEYQLTPIAGDSVAEASQRLLSAEVPQVQFSLTRRELISANSLQDAAASNDALAPTNLADRVLTAQDLYRQTDDTTKSAGTAIHENRLDGLMNVQFQYFDGQSWRPEWNSDQQGGLPQAIALSFDFPARADMTPVESNATSATDDGLGLNEPDGPLPSDPSDMQLSFADAALATEPSAVSASQSESGLMQAGTHEIQIVVYIGGQPTAGITEQASSLQQTSERQRTAAGGPE